MIIMQFNGGLRNLMLIFQLNILSIAAYILVSPDIYTNRQYEFLLPTKWILVI